MFAHFIENSAQGSLMVMTKDDQNPRYLSDIPYYLWGDTSPDRKWLVFEYYNYPDTNELVTLSADGQIQSSLTWDDEWESNPEWLDNERILFKRIEEETVIVNILNPFTAEEETKYFDLPGLFSDRTERAVVWDVVFNPTMSQAVYLQGEQVGGLEVVLWDFEADREIWRLDNFWASMTEPKWSPDGKKLAVVAMSLLDDYKDHYELWIVSNEGVSQKYVDMKGYFDGPSYGDLSWSPDGRYLAFSIQAYTGFPVLVLDLEKKRLFDYCILGGATYSPVVWSPDSRQILVPRQNDPFIVVDLERKSAAWIVQSKDFKPVGWLASNPEEY